MTLHIRRGFIYLFPHNSSFLRKSPICFFTLRPKQPLIPFSEFVNQKHHFHAQASSKVAASAVTIPKHPQKCMSVSTLSFLKQSGFSQTQLDKILKSWPRLLSLNVDKIVKPKIKIFQEFGFSDKEIVEIISNDPSIFHCSANNRVIPSLSVLKGLLGTTSEVAKFLKISSWYFRRDLTNMFLPNIELLKSCGIGMDKITWLMYYFPRFMLQRPENIRKIVQKADQMGADRSSRTFVRAISVISSMKEETLQLKIKAFRELGFSQDDIFKAFRMQPNVFTTSHEKIKKVVELVLATGKYDMSCIVNNPNSLTRSVEKRYKPRFQVLGILEDKNLIKVWPSFCLVYRMTDERFYQKFVDPFINEVGEIYGKKSTLGGKRGAKVVSA